MDAFEPTAAAFRFYKDDGSPSESTSTPIAGQDANIDQSVVAGDKQVHLRYRVDETGAGDIDGDTTDDYTIEYQVNAGGGWTLITASSSRVQADTSSLLSDGSATTNRTQDPISGGSGSFVAGEQEDQDGEIENSQLTGNDFTEHVWALDLISADWSTDDFVEFRMRYNGGAMDNSVTPRITDVLSGVVFDADKFRFYEDDGSPSESASTPIAAEDTDITRNVTSDSILHLRWRVQETDGVDGNSGDDYTLFMSRNSGTFQVVNFNSTIVELDTASELIDGNDTTNRATNGISNGTGSFVAGEQADFIGVTNRQLTADNYTEHVFGMNLISAEISDEDTLDFQLRAPGITVGDIINSIVPRITVDNAAAGTVVQDIIMGPGIIPFAR